MKTIMNYFKLIAVMLIILVARVNAQQFEKNKMNERFEHRMNELTEHLQLRPDQQEKVRTIAENNRKELMRIRNTDKEASRKDKRADFIAQLKKADEQIKEILDPKQKELYKKFKEEKKSERKAKMQEHKERHTELEDGLF